MGNLITLLRETTQPQHILLEAVTRLPQSLESAEDLQRVLATFLGFYTALDPVLHEASEGVVPAEVADRPWRSRVLRRDLIAMGLDDEDLADVPVCARIPAKLTCYSAWGIHYVVEGSALGGKVISSHMKKHSSLTSWDGQLRFFNMYGSDTTSRWKRFMAELDNLNPSLEEQMQIVKGAQMAFSTLTDWFQENHKSALVLD